MKAPHLRTEMKGYLDFGLKWQPSTYASTFHGKHPHLVDNSGPPIDAHGMPTQVFPGQPAAGKFTMKRDFYPDRVTRSYYDGLDGHTINYVPVKHRFDPGAFYMYDRVALLPEPAVVKARKMGLSGIGDDGKLKSELAQFLLKEAKDESVLLKTMGEGSRDPSRSVLAPPPASSRDVQSLPEPQP